MKSILYLALLLITASSLNAQKVKLKKQIVYADDTPAFSFEKKAMGNELYIYKLNTKEELLSIIVDNNKTESKVDDSKQVTFGQQATTIKSKEFRGWTYELVLEELLKSKVIDLNGEINADNLKRFKAKYDNGNVNHTNKY